MDYEEKVFPDVKADPGEKALVGSGQSGCQIAEDLHLAGRCVHLCVGGAPRTARRWQFTWGSGRFSGVARDARFLIEHIGAMRDDRPRRNGFALNERALGS